MAAPKTSILPELRTFVANLDDVPYDRLLAVAAEAGWTYQLREAVAVPANGGTLVTFAVLVGRSDSDAPFEVLDNLTVKTGEGSGPVGMVARVMAHQPLIHLFFGRFPPPPPAQEQEQINVDMTNRYQTAPAPSGKVDAEPDEPAEELRVKVVARREPDGLPIFVDLYDPRFTGRTRVLVDSVLDEIDDFLSKATAVQQVDALPLKNPELINFLRDVGTAEDTTWLRDVAMQRKIALAPPVLATTGPRRRSTATAH